MVVFNELRISGDGSKIYINVKVNSAEYFDNVYLDSITIVTSDKILATAPTSPSSNYIYKKVISGSEKEIALVLSKGDLDAAYINYNPTTGAAINSSNPHATVSFSDSDFSKALFFVYVHTKGSPDECTPCPMTEETTLGVIFDENRFYQKVMDYTRSLAQDCEIPQSFVDFILLWDAFKAAVATGHYIPAIDYYNKLFGTDSGIGTYNTKPCGCHG